MKQYQNTNCLKHSLDDLMPIVAWNETGKIVLKLPAIFKRDQQELEKMLDKVFGGRAKSTDNLALAQQLSLNWCVSKAKKNGMAEECFCNSAFTKAG